MTARWTANARLQQRRWLERLSESDPCLVGAALDDAETLSKRIGARPLAYRASRRWPGFREASLIRWRKLLVFVVSPDEALVTAFYDTRQDFSGLNPHPE